MIVTNAFEILGVLTTKFMEIIKINKWTRWSKMKRFIVIIMIFCVIISSCAKKPINNMVVSTPVKTQNYVGRFEKNASLYRDFGNKLIIQKEQEKGSDIFSLDINEAIIDFEYTDTPQENLLYYKRLDADRILKVKQLGNGEENNMLTLEGIVKRNIANNIAYSDAALVATSPSRKYIVYCKVEDILNQYSLQIYNIETNKTMLLSETVDEVLLNDMQGNISWSPNEDYLALSNKHIFNVKNGKQISEINAESVLWSTGSDKLAYIKSEKGIGKSISLLDINTLVIEEVFIANQGEYLPGNIIWNENGTKLAFVTALIDTKQDKDNFNPYKSIYSLDLTAKEAVRIDTALEMEAEQVSKLESMHYNSTGNLLALTMVDYLGSYLYVYNLNNGEWMFFLNIEYLHYENNEDYICNAGRSICFVQGQAIVELDENMISKQIYMSDNIIEDMYISSDGSSMIIIENTKDIIVLRQLVNFTAKSM